jgi:hypothetical protein
MINRQQEPSLSPDPSDRMPEFIGDNPKLLAAWQRGELRMTSDLIVQPDFVEPSPPVEGPRGLGSRAVIGYKRLMEGVHYTTEESQPIPKLKESMADKIERLSKEAAEKAKRERDELEELHRISLAEESPSDDNRGPYHAADQEDLERIRQNAARSLGRGLEHPTAIKQNENERAAMSDHFQKAGRWQRRRS